MIELELPNGIRWIAPDGSFRASERGLAHSGLLEGDIVKIDGNSVMKAVDWPAGEDRYVWAMGDVLCPIKREGGLIR